MATSFQQQALYRKLIYLGIIVGLFSLSLLHKRLVIEPEALRLQLREQARGEVELTGSVVRLSLMGSRGFAACILWHMALEHQKKHQWSEFEILVRSVTKLQPHFVSPWLFQSWNLAFNVAVECDRPRDKFFYVSRGLELLAEGERRNQGTLDDSLLPDTQALRFPGNPEMRYNLGFFYQLKIAHSDEANAMKCLFDMSCIDPINRDPDQLWSADARGKKVVDLPRFKEFCRRHPRLVRRLYEKLRCRSPKQVVNFLSDNKEVPSRFAQPDPVKAAQRIPTDLRPRRERFPILPPRVLPRMPDPDTREFSEDFDVMSAAQAWYLYAMEPLPPPSPDPGLVEPEFDPIRHRLPKMAVHIFRTYPARAQAYMGEHRQKEGWFDDEGWVIPGWFKDLGERVAVGFESKYQSGPAWHKAYEMYVDYGKETRIYLTQEQRQAMEREAELFRTTYKISPLELPTGLKPEQFQGAMRRSCAAHFRLYWNNYYRTSVAYDDYLGQADAERRPEVLRVRKMFHQAADLRAQAADAQVLRVYEEALPQWVDILLKYPAYRRIFDLQQETYETQLSYLRVLQDQKATILRPLHLGLAQMSPVGSGFLPPPVYLPPLVLDKKVKFPIQVKAGNRDEERIEDRDVLDEADIRRIIPIRKVRGPLEFIYLFETPGREQLQLYLLGLTQGAINPPLLFADYLRDWMLVTRIDRDRAPHQGPWQPLLPDQAISAVRQQLNLDR